MSNLRMPNKIMLLNSLWVIVIFIYLQYHGASPKWIYIYFGWGLLAFYALGDMLFERWSKK